MSPVGWAERSEAHETAGLPGIRRKRRGPLKDLKLAMLVSFLLAPVLMKLEGSA
jgi:hypothetical protein